MKKIHLKTAWNSIRRSPFQALAALFVLTITFFVSTTLAILVYSSDQVIKYFETRPQVIAFIKDDVAPDGISQLQTQLISDPRVKEVTYVTKENALEIYKEATADNPLLAELVSPEIFPASLEFSLTDLDHTEEIISEIKANEIVNEVGFTANIGSESSLTDVVSRLRTISWYLRTGGLVFVGILLGTSLMVLLIIISMRLSARKGEIEILDLIGATPAFIRSPILLESLIYSISGVFIGWLLSLLLALYAAPSLISYFGEINVLPKDTLELIKIFALVLSVEILIGLLLSLSGGLIAVTRSKKQK